MSLTPKQRRFVGEYLKDLNGTQAAIRAGYSAKTANEQAGRLLVNVSVQAEIQRLAAKHFETLDISAERILRELALLAFASVADRDDGFKYTDKIKALELLGKYRKLFTERYELAEPPIDLTKLDDSEFEEFERLAAKCGMPHDGPGGVQ